MIILEFEQYHPGTKLHEQMAPRFRVVDVAVWKECVPPDGLLVGSPLYFWLLKRRDKQVSQYVYAYIFEVAPSSIPFGTRPKANEELLDCHFGARPSKPYFRATVGYLIKSSRSSGPSMTLILVPYRISNLSNQFLATEVSWPLVTSNP